MIVGLEKKSTTDKLFVIFMSCWKLYLMPTPGRMDNGEKYCSPSFQHGIFVLVNYHKKL